MGFLSKLDIFKSVGKEHKEGTLLGTFLTFFSVILIFVLFSKEIKNNRTEKLKSTLYVEDSYQNELIDFEFDIFFMKLRCDVITLSLQKTYQTLERKKISSGEGCRIHGHTKIKSGENTFTFSTDLSTTIMDLISAQITNMGGRMISNNKMVDFSHRINRFQFGKSNRYLKKLEKYYPDMIKAHPLNGVEYVSKSSEDGHSVFLYQLNIVNSKVNGKREIIFNYNKNTINSMTSNPYLNFDMTFSPISVEYEEGAESFWEFITYLLGLIGGILSAIRMFNNTIYYCCFKRKHDHQQIPTVVNSEEE